MTPLRMAIWQRDRDGHPIQRGQLIHHSDAGSQYTSLRLTEHLPNRFRTNPTAQLRKDRR